MTQVDAYGSLPHYREHLWPVVVELRRRGLTGSNWTPRDDEGWSYMGKDADRGRNLCLVAGWADAQRMSQRPLVMIEHGAGQAYDGDARMLANGCYSGGDGLDRVELFVCPSYRVADRWHHRYPGTPTAVVGSPKLDALHAQARDVSRGPRRRVVTLTFHWDCRIIPETRWALPHYDAALPGLVAALRAAGWEVWGHAHPRAAGRLRRKWRALGVPWVPDAATVLAETGVLVADNTSLMYEAASLGVPIVALNAPWYRRSIDHGLRFWDAVPGIEVDSPAEVYTAIEEAWSDPPDLAQKRERAVMSTYALTDGKAAVRAADAIEEVLG